MKVGRYELGGELARGGMGVVYRAFDPSAGRDVALKQLLASGNARQLERFRREAEALGRLRHPNVVVVHDAGQADGKPYLVMELLDGVDLQARIAEGPLAGPEAAQITLALADGLAHAHAAGILHRDLKPSNVFLAERGPVLTDFGLAKVQLDLLESQRLSKTGQFLGTPGYWAPEQARGQRDRVSPASDVYGLGATLYAMLTGEPPIWGSSMVEVLASIGDPVTRPSKRGADVDPALEAICMRCLEKEPEKRFVSARELHHALEDYLEDPTRGAQGSGVFGLVAGLLVVALVAGTGWLLTRTAPPRAPLAPVATASSRRPLDSETQALWKRARAEIFRGELKAARETLNEVIARRPRFAAALARRAYVHNILGDHGSAETDATIALRLAPGSLDARLQRISAHWRLAEGSDRATRARLDAEVFVLIASGAGNAEAHRLRAGFAAAYGDASVSLPEINRTLELEPDNGQALFDRSWYLRGQDRWHEAVADCVAALKLQPRRIEILHQSGVCRGVIKDVDGAVKDFERAEAIDPTDVRTFGNKVAVLVNAQRFRAALVAMEKRDRLSKRPPDANQLRASGVCHANLGAFKKAERDFRQAIETHEGWVKDVSPGRRLNAGQLDVYVFLAICLVQQRSWDEATAVIQDALPKVKRDEDRKRLKALLETAVSRGTVRPLRPNGTRRR